MVLPLIDYRDRGNPRVLGREHFRHDRCPGHSDTKVTRHLEHLPRVLRCPTKTLGQRCGVLWSMVPSRLLGSGFTGATLPPGGIIARPDFSHLEWCCASEAFLGSECVYFGAWI